MIRNVIAAFAYVIAIVAPAAAQPQNSCTVDAKISPDNIRSVVESGQVNFNGQSSGNTAEAYLWRQTSGPSVSFIPSDRHLQFTAPQVGPGGATLTFELTVTGCAGTKTATATATVNVTNLNDPPVAAISVTPSTIYERNLVILDGSGSNDPDGDALTYSWSQTTGPAVSIANASTDVASFTAPAVDLAGTSLAFRLTVGDGTLTSTKDVIVNVVNLNQPPGVTVGCPATVVPEGAEVTLTASATDDEQVVSYSWFHTEGAPSITSVDWASSSFGFKAPNLGLGEAGLLTFKVVVTDNDGLQADASCQVQINDVTAPVLTLPSDITREASAATGAEVIFPPTGPNANDAHDGAVEVTCTPASGATLPLGDTTVSCTAKDAAGNEAKGTFKVTVVDTTPPTLTLPHTMTEEATGPSGAAVSFIATALDVVDGSVAVSCTPESGATLALGTHTVDCSATDAHGNDATGSFTITVQDTTPPALTVPADITKEATGPSTPVTFSTSAADLVDGAVAVICTPASGATFALGAHTVDCSATDAHSNKATRSFTITVQDTTPPALTLPANMTAEATGPSGAAVSFPATAVDIVDGNVTVSCSPASGSTFALGAHTVNCSATDAHANKATGSFTVTVQDTTAPTLTLPQGVSVVATSASGAVATFTPTATDLVDGTVPVTCTPGSGTAFGMGPTTVTCTATDAHGNAAKGSFVVSVLYSTGPCLGQPGHAILQPINVAGDSVFKQKSTVPAKFRVCDANGNSVGALGVVSSFRLVQIINGTVPTDVDDAIDSTTPDTTFRWSTTDQQWIFNMNTKGLAVGLTYVYRITLNDGSKIDFQYGLK